MNNQKAQDAYADAVWSAMAICDRIKGRLEDMDTPSDKTTWGNVGDIARVIEQLREVTRCLGMDEE